MTEGVPKLSRPGRRLVCQWLAACALSVYAPSAAATIVRHLLLPNDSVFSAQSQHACGTYLLQPSPHWCNPALFPFTNEAPIKGDLAQSADRDAYDTTSRLLNEPAPGLHPYKGGVIALDESTGKLNWRLETSDWTYTRLEQQWFDRKFYLAMT